MSSTLSLRPAQRDALLRHFRGHPDPQVRQRAHILLLLEQGYPWATIGAVLFTSPSTIARWQRRFEDGGVDALFGLAREADSRWSDEVEATLRRALERSPDQWGYRAVNWTVFLLRDHVEQQLGQRPCDPLVRQLLRQLGYVWKRPRHALHESKSPRVLRRLRAIRKRVQSLPPGCVKLFEDETDLHLFPPLRAGWFLRGKPAKVPISGENAKRTVFGAINVETGERTLVCREGACAPDFHALLRLVRQAYEGKRVVMLLDGASRHTAHESGKFMADLGIEAIRLPVRCSNINPMDRLWRWGKDKICANKQYLSIDYQADRFIEYLLGLSPEEALRKAGIRSGNFWLFRSPRAADAGATGEP
jgi:transposase